VASVENLKASKSYLEASAFYSNSGMLVGEPSLRVFEVKGSYIGDGDWLAFGSGDNPKVCLAAQNVTQPKSETST
jgi:hypothetical protein